MDGYKGNVLGTAISSLESMAGDCFSGRSSALRKGMGALKCGLLGKWPCVLEGGLFCPSNTRHILICPLSFSPVLDFISVRALAFSSKSTL